MYQSDQIVGTVAIGRLAADVAEVKRLNVTADHRGRGWGDRLFQHALAHATTIGIVNRLLPTRVPGHAAK
jgi:N-acetylglutamate synthase-like GNAT family acetyltransferase